MGKGYDFGMSTAIAMLLRPFAAFLLLTFLLLVRHAIIRFFPNGWLKRVLLTRVHNRGR